MISIQRGFSLIELITVMILLGVLSVVLVSRIGSVDTASLQGSRDDVIAAFSFAQQTAMMRPGISLTITANSISVNENGTPLSIGNYPLAMPANVTLTASPSSFTFDRLGGTVAGSVTVASPGGSASIFVETTGYAHAN